MAEGINLGQASTRAIWTLFLKNQTWAELQPCGWVIDGVDELNPGDRDLLISFLGDLPGTTRVCATSRPGVDISAIEAIRHAITIFNIEPSHTDPDIRTYIRTSLKSSTTLGSPRHYDKVESMLQRHSQGMFLWVSLMLDQLSRARTFRQFDELMEKPPEGIMGLFQQLIADIFRPRPDVDPIESEIIKHIICWAWLSRRPLSLDELETAIELDRWQAGDISKTQWIA